MRLWRRYPVRISVAAIVLLGGCTYFPSLSYPYLQDSILAVARNPIVERGDPIEILTSHYWKDTGSRAPYLYRPTAVASFAVERRLTGEASPLVSHLFNAILHIATALALLFYARRLGARDSTSLTAAALFTVHPLMLQGVANVVGRSDSLALLFSLLALLALSHAGRWRGGQPPSPAVHRTAVWSAAAFLFLALTSKEIALATPLLLFVQEALFRFPARPRGREWWIRRAAGLAPCGLALVVWLVLRTRALGAFPALQAVPPEDNVIVLLDLHGTERVATALGMAAHYARLLLFPSRLSADYSGTAIPAQESVLAFLPLVGLAFLGALLFLAMWPFAGATRRTDERASDVRLLAMGAWMFLLPYLVVGNLVVLNAAGFAERLIYVPAAGFFLIVAVLLGRCTAAFPRLALPVGAGIALIVAVSVVHTREQARMWGSARALFERSLEATPRSLRFNLALGHVHRREGNLELARSYFERNAEYAPTDPGSWSDLGIFLSGTPDTALAEESLRNAIRLDPQRGAAYAHLGKLLRRAGRVAEAERALRKALLLRPDMLISAVELGRLYFDAGRYAEAAFYFRGCVRLGRTDLREMQERAESLARESAGDRR